MGRQGPLDVAVAVQIHVLPVARKGIHGVDLRARPVVRLIPLVPWVGRQDPQVNRVSVFLEGRRDGRLPHGDAGQHSRFPDFHDQGVR